MRNRNCRKLQSIFLFILFYGLNGENIYETSKVQESVIGSMYDVFQTLIEMSNYFERFPMNESYFETQYLSKNNYTTIPANFHQRLSTLLEYYNVDADCRKSILDLQNGLEQQVDWALRMVDAFGKPTSGLVDLGLQWLGSYEECVTAPYYLKWVLEKTTYGFTDGNYTEAEDSGVISQYCRAALPLPLSMVPRSSSYLVHESAPPTVQLGVCFPDKCTEIDVSRVINAVADHVQGSDSEMSAVVQCEKRKDISTGAVVMIVILGVFGAMLMIGTGYDVLFVRMKLCSNSDYLGVYQDEPLELNGTGCNGTTSEVNGTLRENKIQNEASNKPEAEETGYAVNEGRRQETRRKEPESNLHILLMAFSIIKNGETVLNTDTAGRKTNAIEGLRALTLGWIILIHTYTFTVYQSDNHDIYAEEQRLDWTFQPLNAPFPVETFFVISGCLVAYLSLITLSKIGGLRNFPWGKFYLLRIWRLSPSYYFAFFIYWFLVPLLSSGPFWFMADFFVADCPNQWWSILFYVNNFYGARAYGCYGISWYMAADMQCYILSPIIFVLLYWKPKIGITVSLVTIAASCIYTGVVIKLIEFTSTGFVALTTEAEVNWVGMIHFYPFSHFAPYVVGMLTGYLLYRNRTTPILKITTWWQIIGWCVSMIFIIADVYLPAIASVIPEYSNSFNPSSAIYMGLSKLGWGLAVGWIIYACATGYGGFINTFLSWGPFIVLGRLTFSTYLVHVIVLHVIYWPRRTLYHSSDIELAYTTAATIALSYGLGFVLSVCIEQTFAALQKIFLKEKRTL